jgi:hypothetical protein
VRSVCWSLLSLSVSFGLFLFLASSYDTSIFCRLDFLRSYLLVVFCVFAVYKSDRLPLVAFRHTCCQSQS